MPIRFVIDGGTGRLVFPADGTMQGAENLVLFVPREQPEDDHELQLMLSAGPATEAAADRWRAYHGQPRVSAFGSFGIEGVKYDGEVVEDAVSGPNALAGVEGKLCKRLNADLPGLAAACVRAAGVHVKDPLAVGVDEFGVDLKARFGIVRLEFGTVASVADVERMVEALLGGER